MSADVSRPAAIDSVSDQEIENWVRMPANREKLEGLTRATLYDLINDRRSGVISISLRGPGAKRGIRLLDRTSLRRFLARKAAEQNTHS